MQTGREDHLEKVREEHLKRIFDLYEAKSKSFRTVFNGLMGFSFLFLFIILFPYVSIQSENHRIAERLKGLPEEIARGKERMEAYRKVEGGVQRLKDEIQRGPQDLRDFISSLESGPARPGRPFQPEGSPNAPSFLHGQMAQQVSPPSQLVSADPCNALSGEEWVHCKVRQEVTRQFQTYREILRQDVVGALQEIPGGAANLVDRAALDRQVGDLQVSFEKKLTANPRFWETYPGKQRLYAKLNEGVEGFWSGYGAALETHTRRLTQTLEKLQADRTAIEQQQARLKAQEEKVAARLSQIESPLGKLPVGLIESVAVFPVLLAVGFGICVSLLCETVRLRGALHQLYQRRDPDRAVLTDRQIALVAPLWIDPADPNQNRTRQLLILLSPVAIYAVACGLIGYGWTLPEGTAGAGSVARWAYGGLYLMSLTSFIVGYRKVVAALRGYPGECSDSPAGARP